MLSRVQTLFTSPNRKWRWIIFAAMGVAGVVLLLANSPWGIGVTHDSVFYLDSASNLIRGEGLSWTGDRGRIRPLTHFAPLYPLTLSAFVALGVDPEVAALWIAAISFGLIISLIGYLVLSITRRTSIGVLASTLTLLSPAVLGVHTISLSEPIFLLITICFWVMLGRFISEPSKAKFLLVVTLAALGYLTRYIGVTLLLTGTCAIFLLGKREIKSRVRDAIVFFLLSYLPMGLWMIRNYSLTGSMTNRTLTFHPPTGETALRFLDTLVSWVLPFELSEKLQILFIIVATIALVYLSIRAVRNSTHLLERDFVLVIGLFILIYFLSLALSITLVDAATPLDNRILSPAYLGLIPLSIFSTWSAVKHWHNAIVSILSVLLVGLILWNDLGSVSSILKELREEGIGFTSKAWQESETVAWVEDLPPDSLIYSNERFALTYITGRSAFSIPEKINTVTAEVRPEFDQALATMHERLETPDAYLVLFHPFGLRYGMPTRDEITFPLSRLKEFEDSWVYIDPINIK